MKEAVCLVSGGRDCRSKEKRWPSRQRAPSNEKCVGYTTGRAVVGWRLVEVVIRRPALQGTFLLSVGAAAGGGMISRPWSHAETRMTRPRSGGWGKGLKWRNSWSNLRHRDSGESQKSGRRPK